MTSSFKRNQRPATNHSNRNLTPPRVQRTEDYTQSTDSVCNLQTSKLNYYQIQRVVK